MSKHFRRTSTTCSCGQPTNGRTLCSKCEHTLDVALVNIADVHADLELVATRRKAVRYDLPRGKGASKSMPLVLDARFLPDGRGTEARDAARNTVTTWVRVCLEEWPEVGEHPRDTISSCCAYLRTMLSRIAVTTWADEIKREMLDVEKALLRVDARGPERIFAGECIICLAVYEHSPLYALPGDEWVTCPAADCDARYLVAECRQRMHDALEYQWLTASQIADQAVYLQLIQHREWARKKLNRWHADGLLKPAGESDKGEPVFPYGDASRLLVAAATRRKTA